MLQKYEQLLGTWPLFLDDDILSFLFVYHYQRFRFICMSRIPSMWRSVSACCLGSVYLLFDDVNAIRSFCLLQSFCC